LLHQDDTAAHTASAYHNIQPPPEVPGETLAQCPERRTVTPLNRRTVESDMGTIPLGALGQTPCNLSEKEVRGVFSLHRKLANMASQLAKMKKKLGIEARDLTT
jgi:hypothetical protein